MKKNKVLIIGGSGSLGQIVEKELINNDFEVLPSHTKKSNKDYIFIDLRSPKTFDNLSMSNSKFEHVIICSGYEPFQNLKNLDFDHVQKMFQIHVTGPLMLIKYLVSNVMINNSIVLISSVASFQGSYDPSYSAAKGAVNSLTKSLARELAPKIRVNAIAPGLIKNSTVFNKMTTDFKEKHFNSTLLKKFLNPEECSDAILFLMKNKHITGEIININGGQYFG
tara:strand:- start:354 stop:1022 length:669 start_codon:yes stop_codon:yes gene_type:complete